MLLPALLPRVARVPVGTQEMDIYRDDDGLVAHQPGVAGDDEHETIPERVYPFHGYTVTVGINVREANGIVETPINPVVRGACRWQITMNEQVIYGKSAPSARDGLLAAGGAMQRLVELMELFGIRWWDEDSWKGKAIWYQGVAAVLMTMEPSRGRMLLAPESALMAAVDEGETLVQPFPRTPWEQEHGPQPPDGLRTRWVDILDTSVGWLRTQTHVQATPVTPPDTVVVSSLDGAPTEDEAPDSATVEGV